MGGSIAVTYKKSETEIYKMCRWTNPLPFFTTDFNLHAGHADEFSKNFLASWLEMKADYEQHQKDRKFQLNMTGVYFPFSSTYPIGYGLVVIDGLQKKIMSMQGYSNVGLISGYNFFGALNKTNFYDDDDNLEEIENFEKLYNAGYLQKFLVRNEKGRPGYISFESLNIKSFQDLKDYAKTVTHENQSLWSSYLPIFSDWKIERFQESAEGVIEFKQALNKMGYIFDKKEEQGWIEYLNMYTDDLSKEKLQDYKKQLIGKPAKI